MMRRHGLIVMTGTFALCALAAHEVAAAAVDAAGPARMKAVVYSRYGSPDVLEIREVDKPTPGDNEVLIKVRAASANPLDWHLMEGAPYIIRLLGFGLRRPKDTRPGVDVAGQVEAVGRNVTQLKPGDEV